MLIYLLLEIVEEYFAEIPHKDEVVAVSRNVPGRSSLKVVLGDRPRRIPINQLISKT